MKKHVASLGNNRLVLGVLAIALGVDLAVAIGWVRRRWR
jgi:hypothetical protein